MVNLKLNHHLGDFLELVPSILSSSKFPYSIVSKDASINSGPYKPILHQCLKFLFQTFTDTFPAW